MTFDEILEQVITLLKRQGRVSYPALKIRFNLEDDYLEALKAEILYVHPVVDDAGRGLIWTGEAETKSASTSTHPAQPEGTQQNQPTQVEPPPAEPRTREAERRQLTVMFCDLVDSTKLSSQLDPEDYREVVREYQKACAEVIERFDGYVAQYLGDGLLVYFGYPAAHEEDAQRAIHTGLGIVEAIGNLNARLEQDKGIRLTIRLGIHTGLVVVGEMGGEGRQEQLALGETPNIAARIQGIAEPDTVVISDATYRLIQGYFDCQELGERDLRGVTESIVVYRVMRESDVQSRLDVAISRGLTPLVGREQEVGLLLERWEQAKDGQGQIILLSGEAGIGKSRLVQVLKDHVADEPHTRWECRSSPYYQNTALYPLIDLLQRALQWRHDDTPDERLEKLERLLSQYRLPLAETIPLFAPLLSLPIPDDRYPPLNLSPQRQRQKTLESIVAILLELAERELVLFILEDLHWTDPTTLEFLSLLVEQVPTAAMYTLLTCRPHFQPAWHHRSYLTEITVNRLSRNQIEQMATRVAGGKSLPVAIIEQLVDKTDGVPLYVEEMTKAILEAGHLKATNEHYELTGTIASLAIPATLQDSLMARLDRLMTAKGIAQLGAVIGRQFSFDLLKAVSQLDESALQRELGRLVEAELVYQRGLPPQAMYTFKHALVQDAAYASLLKSTRQQYHHSIAQALEQCFPETVETQPELLAHHYTEAGMHEQAVRYWQQAGEKAIHHLANAEAIHHLTKGLEGLNTLPATPERAHHELSVLIMLGSALIATKGYTVPEVASVYNRAYDLCQRVGEEAQRFSVLTGLRRFYQVGGDLGTAREIGEQLLTIAQHQQDPTLLLEAYWSLSSTLFFLGEFAFVQDYLAQAMHLYEAPGGPSRTLRHGIIPGMHCLSWLSVTLWMRGYADQARHRSQEALTLAYQLSPSFSQAFVLTVAAWLHQFRREGAQTQAYAEALTTVAHEQAISSLLPHGIFLRGWALSAQGQREEGIEQMCQGLLPMRTGGNEVNVPFFLALLAEVYQKAGQIEAGLNTLAEAWARVEQMGTYFYESELHRLTGELLLQQSADHASEAESCFQQAIRIAQRQQAKSLELRDATSLAKLWQRQDKHKEAYDLLAPVYGWFTEGFDTADLKDAKELLDELEDGRS